MDPLTGKLRFKLRTLANWLFAVGIFIPLAAIFSFFPYAWLADIVLIGLLCYFFFYVWDKRPIWVRCPHCTKRVATNTPWVCGFCQEKNHEIDEYPFVYRCGQCGAEPKAYKCHHRGCGKLIFLTSDELEQNYAVCLNSDAAPPVEDAPVRYEQERRALEHEIMMLELAAKLETSKQRFAGSRPKSPSEEIEESFTRYYSKVMGSNEFSLKQKAANAEKFKNDPDMLRRANLAVDQWLDDRT